MRDRMFTAPADVGLAGTTKSGLVPNQTEEVVKPYLTVQEVADVIRAEERTVRRAINRGDLEASYVAGRWLVEEDALKSFVDARRAPTPRMPAIARPSPRRSPAAFDSPGSTDRLKALEGNPR